MLQVAAVEWGDHTPHKEAACGRLYDHSRTVFLLEDVQVNAEADEPRACADDPCGGGATSLACERCFAQAHVFAEYLRLVDEGERPTCM